LSFSVSKKGFIRASREYAGFWMEFRPIIVMGNCSFPLGKEIEEEN